MSKRDDADDVRSALPLSSAELAVRLREAAVPLARQDVPGTCSIQRFSNGPDEIDFPGHTEDVLIGHLAAPFFVEASGTDQPTERRWISPGQIGINAAGQPIHRRFKGRPDVVLVHLDAEMLQGIVEDVFERDPALVHLVPKLGDPDETAFRLIQLLLREAEQPMTGTDLAVDGLSRALIVHTLRSHSNLSVPVPAFLPTLSPVRLKRVTEFMRAHLDEPVPLERLAGVAGLSSSHLGRAFREATGQSPHRFLIALRVARACEMLEATDLPIVEVGLRCGFAQASHFATSFRKATGAAPRDWRRIRRM